MRIIILQDDLYSYLVHVVKAYASSGINPEEGQALYFLNKAVAGGRQVDDKQVAKLSVGDPAPEGASTLLEKEEGGK